MSSSPETVQPGWYDDPQTPGTLRWHDGEAWSPFTKAADAADGPARPSTTTALATRHDLDRTSPAGRAPTADWAPADRAPAVVPTPHRDPAPAWSAAPTPAATAHTPSPAPAWPVPPAPAGVAPAAPPAPAARALPAFLPPAAPTRPAVVLPPAAPTRPAVVLPPTDAGLRLAVGRLAARLPRWLPSPVAGPLSRRMARYAAGTGRPREGITDLLRRLAFPAGGAWQASTAALLGLLTVALAVWPLVGAGAWLVTCAFAGLAFRRLRHDVLLGGVERAWFGIACGVAPLWTGLLALSFR